MLSRMVTLCSSKLVPPSHRIFRLRFLGFIDLGNSRGLTAGISACRYGSVPPKKQVAQDLNIEDEMNIMSMSQNFLHTA
jgi:hypothetical protein